LNFFFFFFVKIFSFSFCKVVMSQEEEDESTAWCCLNVATRIGKLIELSECDAEPNAELAELKQTVAFLRSRVVPFIQRPANEAAYDMCIESVRTALLFCESQLLRIDELESSSSSHNTSRRQNDIATNEKQDDDDDERVYETMVELYRGDFQLKLAVDQLCALFPKAGESPAVADAVVEDAQGRALWKTAFNGKLMVPWPRFFKVFQSFLSASIADEEDRLRYFVDFMHDGFVTPFEFGTFLKWFGPLSGCIERVLEPLRAGVLAGFIPAIEAHYLLRARGAGTFLYRFSKTRAGAFALTFKDSKARVKHCLLYKTRDGVTLKNPPDVYASLLEFTESHSSRLKTPIEHFDGDRILAKRRQAEAAEQGAASSSSAVAGGDSSSSSAAAAASGDAGTSNDGGANVESDDDGDGDAGDGDSGKKRSCCVCLDEVVQTVFLECGHLACCRQCAQPLKICPICRAPITRVVPIFPI
jgi:CBL proto-oncogene N-terminus, EF hand-like domain/Zinc finger, C3HC4 type (RING finger)/SH2 domain